MTEYKVIGSTPYAGRQPGEMFEADLDENAERRALERGSLEIVKPKPSKKEEASDG